MSVQGSPTRAPQFVESNGPGRLHMSLAISEYDHCRDLMEGRVRPEGISLTPLTLPIEEIFARFIKYQEFDVAETSFAKYLALTAAGDAPMVGIPVFPSRVFRHSAIYVRKDKNIKTAKDLEGLTIGIPEWAQTAGIYVRGFLSEFYNVDLTSIRWVQASVNQPGRQEKVAIQLPNSIRYESRPQDSLNAMLVNGEIDAAITARAPDCFLAHHPDIERLWSDFQSEEARFYQATGVFPIMHVVTIRREMFERHPWVAMNLLTAFEEAKDACLTRLMDITASRMPLPWATSYAQTAQAVMGHDIWPYGLEPNRPTLEAFCRYAHNQGLASRLLKIEDLFPKETHASIKV